jgi:hypothetical protein
MLVMVDANADGGGGDEQQYDEQDALAFALLSFFVLVRVI